MTKLQDQNVDNEDANSSNSSLRRKLFFNHEDCTEDEEEESSFSLSPSKLHGSVLQSSPPQSGMLNHGTPLGVRKPESLLFICFVFIFVIFQIDLFLKERSFVAKQRTHGTPYAGNLSPPNMSPIGRHDMSCQSIRSRCQLAAARLDFTAEMSIDRSILDDDDGLKSLEDVDEFDTSACFFTSFSSRCSFHSPMMKYPCFSPGASSMIRSRIEPETRPDNEASRNRILQNRNQLPEENFNLTTITSDWLKINSNEAFQRNETILGNSLAGHPSWNGHSTQDTGYQTRSITNITENTENTEAAFSISVAPITKPFSWNDKIFSNGEEIILSDWKDNMKNMFSSTPSKYSRRKDQ